MDTDMARPKVRQPGTCSMRGNCGKKGYFSPELPCPVDDQPAQEVSGAVLAGHLIRSLPSLTFLTLRYSPTAMSFASLLSTCAAQNTLRDLCAAPRIKCRRYSRT